MDKDILTTVLNDGHRFSKGQRLIAKYISENYDKAAFMTAGKLGKAVGVSESTVVRFAAELGYDGYPGMRRAMQDMIRNRLTSVQRIEVAKDYIDDRNVLRTVMNIDMEKLQTTIDEANQVDFDRAIEYLLDARNIYIVGMRSSTALANFMGFYLNFLMDNVHVVHDTAVSEVYEQIMRIGKGDVFVGMSYPRYSTRTVKAMRYARDMGATTIAMTDSGASPLVDIADVTLFAKSDMVSFLDSLVAPMSLINAVIVAVGLHSKGELSDTFSKLEGIWSDYDVYDRIKD